MKTLPALLIFGLTASCALSCGSSTSGNDSDSDNDAQGNSGGNGPAKNESGGSDGSDGSGGTNPSETGTGGTFSIPSDALGPYPVDSSPITRGGTMTFTNVGAPGWWPRRIDRDAEGAVCDYKDGSDTWGGDCCMESYETTSDRISPFDEEMTLILKAIEVKQLAIYQPTTDAAGAAWGRVTAWDQRGKSENIWFTQSGAGQASFPGDLTKNDCVGYVMQEPSHSCPGGLGYLCPNDPGILHHGYVGSKLVVFLGSMDIEDSELTACNGTDPGHPGPWVAFVASELVRDGGRKWNGLCNCYSKTGSVGDGCGEINVFEVVMDNNQYSNREFASTGVRSYQEGHVGGAVCGSGCDRDAFLPLDVDVVSACGGQAYSTGPEIVVGGTTDGCPVWRRPKGDRYFFILLDETTRTIQVGMIHPEALPAAATGLLPNFPGSIDRSVVDAMVQMRLPQ